MNDPAGVPSISPAEAERRLREGDPDGRTPLLVDVRNPDEYLVERVTGSRLLPLPEFAARFEELPRDRPLFLICHSGSRSGAATAFLASRGWAEASNVTGGMVGWRWARLPVASGPLSPGEGD
jgi:phage shock protein E